MPSILHAGCGTEPLPAWLSDYDETRLDIDPSCGPDILASLTDMGAIGPFDAIYCSHTLEHLFPHDVNKALGEFHRVLKPGGHAIIFVPDLEGVEPTEEPLYESASGPICGRDLYYGLPRYVEMSPYMAHRTGFVRDTLDKALNDAGFEKATAQRTSGYNLLGVAIKA